MKNVLSTILLTLLSSIIAFAQVNSTVSITMKNGMVISGILKSYSSATGATLIVSGAESVIPTSEIESIQEISTAVKEAPKGRCVDTDLPETIVVDIEGIPVEMKLVRATSYDMGYNGRHSVMCKSEPIHKVNLSSFYVSSTYMTVLLAEKMNAVITKQQNNQISKKGLDKKDVVYLIECQKCEECLPSLLSALSKYNARILTEAEWEYLFCNVANIDFCVGGLGEICQDFWYDFSSREQTDPIAETESPKGRVLRWTFDGFGTNEEAAQYIRMSTKSAQTIKVFGLITYAGIHIVIPAKDYCVKH